MFFDSSYLLIIVVTLILGLGSQAMINRTYKKWSKVPARSGITGAEMARRMLDANGLYDVSVVRIAGELTDNYDPRTSTLHLSEGVYGSTSVAATAIACHEAGHAVQHAKGYAPIKIRMAVVPVVNLASNLWMILLVVGFILNIFNLVWAAIAMYACVVAFQIVTLPVEFNASGRAMNSIRSIVMLPEEQYSGARSVLTAAAMTYVASALASILQLLYYIGLAGRRD